MGVWVKVTFFLFLQYYSATCSALQLSVTSRVNADGHANMANRPVLSVLGAVCNSPAAYLLRRTSTSRSPAVAETGRAAARFWKPSLVASLSCACPGPRRVEQPASRIHL